MVKHHARKNAAKKRQRSTGQRYAEANRKARILHGQQPAIPLDDRPMSSENGLYCAFMLCKAAHEMFGSAGITQLIRHADSGEPITCFLCDEQINTRTEGEVHIGVTFRETLTENGTPVDATMPVWTHPRCSVSRVWTWSQISGERNARGLHAEPGSLPTRPSDPKVEDYTAFSLAQITPNSETYPLVVVQSGTPHLYGAEGFIADRLSEGLGPVDLRGSFTPETDSTWKIRCEHGRLAEISRCGGHVWYRQDGGHDTPEEWKQAARDRGKALLLVTPYGQVDFDAAGVNGLVEAQAQQRLLGALVPITGMLREQG